MKHALASLVQLVPGIPLFVAGLCNKERLMPPINSADISGEKLIRLCKNVNEINLQRCNWCQMTMIN